MATRGLELGMVMKRIARVFRVLGAIAFVVLVLAWIEGGSSGDPQTEVACTYYRNACVLPAAFSGIAILLTP